MLTCCNATKLSGIQARPKTVQSQRQRPDKRTSCVGNTHMATLSKLATDSGNTLLQAVPQKHRTVLEFEGVDAFVPVLPGAGGSGSIIGTLGKVFHKQHEGDVEQGAAKNEKQILFSMQGRVEPGEMLALMGPSGSGKSSLLTVLGGRNAARTTGRILFNGRPLEKSMKRKLAYVSQDDLLFGELTTFETLYYAAMLRLPREWSKEQKIERVERVITGLGLTKARDTIIGGQFVRGVSGGERKRVSIGHELLTNPSVIFLDEPTSGLDSTTALNLIHTLHALAGGGRTIIASIHQPSSRLYKEFDKLMLLGNGYTLYYGEAQAAALWFAQQGYPVPFGVSMPDHLLDLANGDVGKPEEEDAKAVQQRLVTAWKQRDIGTGVHGILPGDFPGIQLQQTGSNGLSVSAEDPAAVVCHATLPSTAANRSTSNAATRTTSDTSIEVVVNPAMRSRSVGGEVVVKADDMQLEVVEEVEHRWNATWLQQVQILTSRSIKTRSVTALSWQKFVEILVPAVLGGLFWLWKGGSGTLSKDNVINLYGLLFFELIFMSFSPLFQALFTFPPQISLLVKERQSGMYRLSAYYTARILSDIPMDCAVPTIFAWILFWMSGMRIQAGAFFLNWLIVVLNVLVAQGMGLVISASLVNPRTIMTVATVTTLIMMLVSGFYVRHIHIWVDWLKYLSFLYYSYNLMLITTFKGRGYDCADYYGDHPDAPPGKTWCSIADGGVLPIDINARIHPALDACMLIFFLVFFRVVTYMVLNRRTKFKQH